jgi:hypothetical protein
MFILDRQAFKWGDRSTVNAFVACWEHYYRGAVSISASNKEPIDYFSELNISKDLTNENVTRLLRWKDPRRLSHTDAKQNPTVVRVLNQLDTLNRFRRSEIDTAAFQNTVQKDIFKTAFESSVVWPGFLFHLANPLDWPIPDDNVFRAHKVLFNVKISHTMSGFQQYKATFADLAGCLRSAIGVDANDPNAVVRSNKNLDSALWIYGKFLSMYDR